MTDWQGGRRADVEDGEVPVEEGGLLRSDFEPGKAVANPVSREDIRTPRRRRAAVRRACSLASSFFPPFSCWQLLMSKKEKKVARTKLEFQTKPIFLLF
jgi:hypothetical protein